MRSPAPLFAAFLKWCLALGVLGGAAYGFLRMHERARDDATGDAAAESGEPAAGEGVVDLEQEAAERLGIAVQEAQDTEWTPRLAVYGRVVPNARATAEVRAAFAGVLRAPPDGSWPTPGQRVAGGQVLGQVDVRVGPEMRMDLQNKLVAARLRRRGEEEVVQIHERTVESLQKVTDRQILSRVELDTARVNLAEAKIQLATARESEAQWEKALQDVDRHRSAENSTWSQTIVAPSDGEVTELAGRPGMAVEPGTLILQLVDFHRPLVRLDIPADVFAADALPVEIALEATTAPVAGLSGVLMPQNGNQRRSTRPARLVGPAPSVDFSAQLIGYWYEVRPVESTAHPPAASPTPQTTWRPGLQVKAELPIAGLPSQPAVAVPVSAVVFHEGRSLVYVRVGEEKYERREVKLLGREGDSWIVLPGNGELPVGVRAGESVVHRQTQVLLSKEFLKGIGDSD